MPHGDLRARLRIVVSGRVQGVFFRGTAAEQARALGLTGYARNLDDGTVEIVAEGSRRALEVLAAWAHRGPGSRRSGWNGASRLTNLASSEYAEGCASDPFPCWAGWL
jgi:acylphosphatase